MGAIEAQALQKRSTTRSTRRRRGRSTRCLRAANGKVYEPGGAAQLLGLKPTNLASRIKSLGILLPNPNHSERG
jgi:transcriptional regulator with GAF, ATPase, and Fis domain